MTHTTVYRARRILTLNPRQPLATHVAVRDGRILAVGDAAQAQAWGAAKIDERYADQVLLPGLVEGHSHLVAGSLWQFTYVGLHERMGPDARRWPGCNGFDAIIERLQSVAAQGGPEDSPLIAWGFDPIFFGDARLTVRELDQVSSTRPVILVHASHHLMNVNSAALARAGIDRDTQGEGVVKFPNGEPTGELQEFAAMFPIVRITGHLLRLSEVNETGLRHFGQLARRAGVTTATDLVNDLSTEGVALLERVTGEPDFPVRIVPAYASLHSGAGAAVGLDRVRAAVARRHERLWPGPVKLVVDGSLQGFTARLRWPGYFNGRPNGIWVLPPAQLKDLVLQYHVAGLQMHIHTNGDEATELALDALQAALTAHPRPDHRHTLQHCQMADAAQFRRMAALGVGVNLFANHLYYWGDAHLAQTMGPDRAQRLDACRTALEAGVPLAIHSDAPVTPLGPLFTAWCAANRRTASGQVLGEAECLSVSEALHAVTLGAAYSLKLDHEIGSIEVGKRADFCVVDRDPLAEPAAALKDVRVLGTVLGGRPTGLGGRPTGQGGV